MARTLTIMIGALFGLVGGAMAAQALAELGTNRIEKAVAGLFAGGFLGLVGGSVGADLAGQVSKDSSRTIYGIMAGATFGALGAMQSEGLLRALRQLMSQFSGIH